MSRVELKGMANVQRALAKAARDAREGAIAAVAAEVDAIGDDAQAGAPVDTGALRGGIKRHAAGLLGMVRSTARHANFVEHGTFKDPAQPYMAPAAERSRKRFPVKAGAIIRSRLGR